jgi:hypothetical protein
MPVVFASNYGNFYAIFLATPLLLVAFLFFVGGVIGRSRGALIMAAIGAMASALILFCSREADAKDFAFAWIAVGLSGSSILVAALTRRKKSRGDY